MGDLHYRIAVGLATELRVFCRPLEYHFTDGDWFRWEWGTGMVDVQLFDGVLTVLSAPREGVAGELPPRAVPLVVCDLADPGLVEVLRVRLRR